MPFDRILDEVREGRADVGLIIHEGQLTYGGHGPAQGRSTSAPGGRRRRACRLPLGGNAVRRDLGPGPDGAAHAAWCARPCATRWRTARRRSRTRMSFARGMDPAIADRFVGHVGERA